MKNPKAKYEKSIRISNNAVDKKKSAGQMPSYVEGQKASKTSKPKSLTPQPKKR